MAQSLARTGSVHHSVSYVSPRPAMRSDGAQLFPTYSPQTEALSKTDKAYELMVKSISTLSDTQTLKQPIICRLNVVRLSGLNANTLGDNTRGDERTVKLTLEHEVKDWGHINFVTSISEKAALCTLPERVCTQLALFHRSVPAVIHPVDNWILAPPAGKISDLFERGLSSWPWLKSAGARYDAARLVRGSNKMLSDLAPLEMSAPEPADARLSRVGSAQTPLRLAQLLPVRSREDDTYARPDKTSSSDERGPDDAFLPHSPIFLPHILCFLLFLEKCICYCPAAAVAEMDLCCPSAQCSVDTTKSMCDDDVGKGRNRSTPKCPVIALVNQVKGDEAPKRHPTQSGTQSQHSLLAGHKAGWGLRIMAAEGRGGRQLANSAPICFHKRGEEISEDAMPE
ncbi:hypothetical protein Q8A73_011396 [Channa argus]|nr:hypothetical protein Q8A73_011396 [Channa argus]